MEKYYAPMTHDFFKNAYQNWEEVRMYEELKSERIFDKKYRLSGNHSATIEFIDKLFTVDLKNEEDVPCLLCIIFENDGNKGAIFELMTIRDIYNDYRKSHFQEVEQPNSKHTMLQSWYEAKAQEPDALILLRTKDHYVTLGEDARVLTQVLGITLLNRGDDNRCHPQVQAYFPHDHLDEYLPRIIRKGYRVAIHEFN